MRFHDHGPNIPDELISAQQRGNVVFFCGAGVSVPARLPTFLGLARTVMRKLGVSKTSSLSLGTQKEQIEKAYDSPREKSVELPFSLDQTFYLLQQEYGKDIIAQEVLNAVKIKKTAYLSGHRDILRLSKNRYGKAQVVTTNFDLLFEYADDSLRSYVPPGLPSLANGQQIDGIVYLHGKWHKPTEHPNSHHNLIISSADFGRAYLAEGWASTFIKDLARDYVIVLLGYSAEDPPVRYLLEGLHAQERTNKAKIYSFDIGTAEQVSLNWQHRGVTGISFAEYSHLWESLNTWADFVEDPRSWHNTVALMALQSPTLLTPHQRGQVAFSISTLEGAKKFAESMPPPPAEWLCVFDSRVRNRKPYSGPMDMEDEPYSFQDRYALDDDIYLAQDSEEQEIAGTNYLSELAEDERRHGSFGLAVSNPDLPMRLRYLSVWFSRVLTQPISLWWLSGKVGISETLRNIIEHQLRQNPGSDSKILGAWWSFIQRRNGEQFNFDGRLYRFKDAVNAQGWNIHMLYALEDALRPLLDVKPARETPPSSESEVVNFDVKIPEMSGVNLVIPNDQLDSVLELYRRCLESYLALSKEVSYTFFPDFLDTPTHAAEPGLYAYVQWFKDLYAQLCNFSPLIAKHEANSWRPNEPSIFAPLRIHAWNIDNVWEGHEVCEGLCTLPEDFFWDNKQHIARLAGKYWSKFSKTEKTKILRFVRRGPSEEFSPGADEKGWSEVWHSAPVLIQMEEFGCELDSASQALIRRAQASSSWIPMSERHESPYPVVYSVTKEIEPSSLLALPLDEIVPRALEDMKMNFHARTQYDPFEGLLKVDGVRAYRALVKASKNNIPALPLWKELFDHLPENTSRRAYICITERTLRMPEEMFDNLRYSVSNWLKKVLPVIARHNHSHALLIWDRIFNRLIETSDGKISGYGVEKHGLRGYALNAPLGKMLMLLLELCTGKDENPEHMKDALLKRLNIMMSASIESRFILVNMGISQLHYFNSQFPTWTKTQLLPRLKLSDESA